MPTSCVCLHKLLNLSEPHFFYVLNGDNDSAYSKEFLLRSNYLKLIKNLEPCLKHRKYRMNIC